MYREFLDDQIKYRNNNRKQIFPSNSVDQNINNYYTPNVLSNSSNGINNMQNNKNNNFDNPSSDCIY